MAQIDYAGPAALTLNGRPLVETVSVNIKRMSNSAKIKTLAKGLAGRTKGAPEVTVSMKHAVPATGYEAKWNDLVLSQDIVTVGVVIASTEELFEGWFETSDTDSEIDQPIGQTVEFHGRRKSSRAA